MSLAVVLRFVVFVATLWAASVAGAIGFELGESKEDLKLQYDVAVTDHGTGRVTIVLTLTDEGRLGPLTGIWLSIPAEEKHADGSSYVDLSIELAVHEEIPGKKIARVHILKEWAERATIQLKTGTIDGKSEPLAWYYHTIRVNEHLEKP